MMIPLWFMDQWFYGFPITIDKLMGWHLCRVKHLKMIMSIRRNIYSTNVIDDKLSSLHLFKDVFLSPL